MAQLSLPFKLKRPDPNTPAVDDDDIGHKNGTVKQVLDNVDDMVLDVANSKLTWKDQTFFLVRIIEEDASFVLGMSKLDFGVLS